MRFASGLCRHRDRAFARPTIRIVAFAMLGAALLFTGCSKKRSRTAAPVSTRPPMASVPGAWEEGIASWYGDPYHGRRTANGEVYDQEKMTAAHPTLAFNTTVEVENLGNGLRTQVRINDRGPFVKNRAIDLSRAAAREIEMIGPGTAPVRIVVLNAPPPKLAAKPPEAGGSRPAAAVTVPAGYPAPGAPDPGRAVDGARAESKPGGDSGESFAVQMGAFASYENAARLRDAVAGRVSPVRIVAGDDPADPTRVLWRVLAGEKLSRAAAEELFSLLSVDFPRIILVSDH